VVSSDDRTGALLEHLVSGHRRVTRVESVKTRSEAFARLQSDRPPDSFNSVLVDCVDDEHPVDDLFLRFLAALGFASSSLVVMSGRNYEATPGMAQKTDFLSKPVGPEAVAVLLDRLPGVPRMPLVEDGMRLRFDHFPARGLRWRPRKPLSGADIAYFEEYSKGCLVHLVHSPEPLLQDFLDFEALRALNGFEAFVPVGERFLVNAREVAALTADLSEPVLTMRDAATVIRDRGPAQVNNINNSLGTFRSVHSAESRVFLSYSWRDADSVRELHERLAADKVNCWVDKVDLVPGEAWESGIEEAIQNCNHFVALLSSNSVGGDGYVGVELQRALDVFDNKPRGHLYIIPVRLEECRIPTRLSRLHWVDLFAENGYERLLAVLRSNPDALKNTIPRNRW
jgi:hypothetical protein